MLWNGIGAREEVPQASDQCTSMQGMQRTGSRRDLPGSTTSNSVSRITGKQVQLAHLGMSPPIFFMNIITSDSLRLPFASVPIVSWELPYTYGTAKETKSPS